MQNLAQLMETLLQDIRFGFRQLMKQPGFAALAIISMALGCLKERASVVRHSQGQAAGVVADCAVSAGLLDFIPSYFSRKYQGVVITTARSSPFRNSRVCKREPCRL